MYTHTTTLALEEFGFKRAFDYLPGFLCREQEDGVIIYAIGTVWLYAIKADGTTIKSFRLLKRYIKDLIEKGLVVEGD